MSAELILSILNPTIATAFAALVAVLYWRWPKHTYLLPLSIAFFYLGLAFLAQEWDLLSVPGGINYASNAFFYCAVLLACVGAMVRVGARVPVAAFGALTILAVAGFLYFTLVAPSTIHRILVINGSFTVLTGVTIWKLLAAGVRTPVDRFFVAGVALGAVIAVARPLLFLQYGPEAARNLPVSQSAYWDSVLALTPLMAIFIAGVFIFALVYDIVGELQHAADEDHLTGLLNRRGFERAANVVLKGRQGGPAVLVADIDDFKQINDRFGHAAGDRVIAMLGATLAQHGHADAAARIGGEEYALLYRDATLDTLRARADDIAAALSQQPVPGLPETYRTTVSIGLYRRAAVEPLGDMLKLADHALYRAKAAGKNRAASTPSLRLSA